MAALVFGYWFNGGAILVVRSIGECSAVGVKAKDRARELGWGGEVDESEGAESSLAITYPVCAFD